MARGREISMNDMRWRIVESEESTDEWSWKSEKRQGEEERIGCRELCHASPRRRRHATNKDSRPR